MLQFEILKYRPNVIAVLVTVVKVAATANCSIYCCTVIAVQVTAVKVAATANPALAKPLREQAFSTPQKLADIVAKVNDALAAGLPAAAAKLRLYLPSPHTRTILFKPIKLNICEAHGQVASLLAAEYSPEEGAAIPLTPPAELTTLLDAMC